MSLVKRGEPPIAANVEPLNTFDSKKIYNTCYTGIANHKIAYDNTDYAGERDKALNHWCEDGVKPMTPEDQAFEREVNWKMVKKFTKKIFSLDLQHFSFPVAYSEPRSLLERMTDLFSFLAMKYADLAAAATTPEDRFKYIAAGIIASFHLYNQAKKPWNPVIGETYVAHWPNGTVVYGEQVCHHPPVSRFEIFGKDNAWKCIAQCNFTIDNGMIQITIHQKGLFYIEFPDGDKCEWEFPDAHVRGLLHGDRIVRVAGKVKIQNVAKNLELCIHLAPKKDKKLGINDFAYTHIYGGIRPLDTKKKDQYTHIVKGDYCRKVFFDDEVIYDIEKDIVQRPIQDIDEEEILPSDSRFRIDRAYLIDKQPLEVADKVKESIEIAQRREEKLRICVKPSK